MASMPARIALITFFMLLMFSVIWSIRVNILLEKDQNVLRSIPQIILVVALTFIVPICVYFAVKLLREGDVSEYGDIDTAWQKGIDAVEQYGIDLQYTPFFIVVGTPNGQIADHLHSASMLEMEFAQIPGGNGPLQWFASKQAIFLHLTDCCCLSKLVGPGESERERAYVPNQIMATLQLDLSEPAEDQIQMHTVDSGSDAGDPVSSLGTGWHAAMHTLQPESTLQPGPSSPPRGIPKFGPSEPLKSVITTQELSVYAARLKYVIRLIRKHRYPVCPINGALAVLPFSMIESAPDQIQLAWRRDLEVMSESTQMRFPVTMMISEMEKEPGFMEMVRRIGMDASKQRRFGKGFGSGDSGIWTPPNENRLRALAQLACRAFQDNVYFLFSRRDSLRKSGNGQLYRLLNRVHQRFSSRLETTLINSISNLNIMLTGCYFGATGATEDQQAFVKSVFGDRLIGNVANISWDESAASQNRRYKSISNVMALVGLVSLILLITMIVISLAT